MMFSKKMEYCYFGILKQPMRVSPRACMRRDETGRDGTGRDEMRRDAERKIKVYYELFCDDNFDFSQFTQLANVKAKLSPVVSGSKSLCGRMLFW